MRKVAIAAGASGNGKTTRNHRSRRRRYPVELARFPVVRLRTPREVEAWLEETTRDTVSQAFTATERLR